MITLDYPTLLSNEIAEDTPDMSPHKMRQALALSMGIILARAVMMPSATVKDDSASGHEYAVRKFPPSSGSVGSAPGVKIVLPRPELRDTTTCLEWQHLEPWNGEVGGRGLSEHLLTYTISLPLSPNINNNTKNGSSAVKRQKRLHKLDGGSSMDLAYSSDEDDEDESTGDRDFQCTELAHATAQFLLETNSLTWFQRPGGVLLMVMSLTLSRGIDNLKGEMDDPTAKMTSNFGHCSQELINLLLTGQAGKLVKILFGATREGRVFIAFC